MSEILNEQYIPHLRCNSRYSRYSLYFLQVDMCILLL